MEQSYHSALVVVTRVRRIGSEAVLVREGAESVGAEVDERFHVLFCEAAGRCFGLVVPISLVNFPSFWGLTVYD